MSNWSLMFVARALGVKLSENPWLFRGYDLVSLLITPWSAYHGKWGFAKIGRIFIFIQIIETCRLQSCFWISSNFSIFSFSPPERSPIGTRECFRPAPAAAVNQPHGNNVQSSQRIREGLSKDRPSRYPEAPISNLASIKVKPREIKVLPKSTTVLGTYTFSPILRSRVLLLSPNLVHKVQLDSLEVRSKLKN